MAVDALDRARESRSKWAVAGGWTEQGSLASRGWVISGAPGTWTEVFRWLGFSWLGERQSWWAAAHG